MRHDSFVVRWMDCSPTASADLFEAIERGEGPTYTVYVQTMTPEQAEKFRYSILDLTKSASVFVQLFLPSRS